MIGLFKKKKKKSDDVTLMNAEMNAEMQLATSIEIDEISPQPKTNEVKVTEVQPVEEESDPPPAEREQQQCRPQDLEADDQNTFLDLLHHLNYLELYIPPAPRQVWEQAVSKCGVKAEWGSSLARTKEKRGATPSDLCLDLVYVVLLAQLGRTFRTDLDDNPGYAFRDFAALFIPICRYQSNQIELTPSICV